MVSDNIDTISYHAVIRYLDLKGVTHKHDGHTRGECSMVKKWAAEFKRGIESLDDDPRPRRPVTVTTQETTAMADRRLTEYYIAAELAISQDCIHAVIHNVFPVSKVSARCIQQLHGPDLKRTWFNMSRGNLVIFQADPNSFHQRCMTMDKTWAHCFQPEMKQQ